MTAPATWRVGSVDPRQVVDAAGCVVATASSEADAATIAGLAKEVEVFKARLALAEAEHHSGYYLHEEPTDEERATIDAARAMLRALGVGDG